MKSYYLLFWFYHYLLGFDCYQTHFIWMDWWWLQIYLVLVLLRNLFIFMISIFDFFILDIIFFHLKLFAVLFIFDDDWNEQHCFHLVLSHFHLHCFHPFHLLILNMIIHLINLSFYLMIKDECIVILLHNEITCLGYVRILFNFWLFLLRITENFYLFIYFLLLFWLTDYWSFKQIVIIWVRWGHWGL